MVSAGDFYALKDRVCELERLVRELTLTEERVPAMEKRGPGRPPKDRAAA